MKIDAIGIQRQKSRLALLKTEKGCRRKDAAQAAAKQLNTPSRESSHVSRPVHLRHSHASAPQRLTFPYSFRALNTTVLLLYQLASSYCGCSRCLGGGGGCMCRVACNNLTPLNQVRRPVVLWL
jgi:hypothetical protein